MNHSFDVDIARVYGVDAAVLIENFRFWIAKNKANGRHCYDGRWWTYNSAKAMTELFPYWSQRQIERLISKLKDAGVLLSGHYSENAYDRTNWYSINEDALPKTGATIHQNASHHSPKRESPFTSNGESDTDINTDINTDIKPDTYTVNVAETAKTTPEPIAEPDGSARVEMPPNQKKTTRKKREKTTLKTYLEHCKANGQKPIPSDHPVRQWAEDAGIPDEMLQIAWLTFRETYLDDPKHKSKLYTDWPAHFANSVKGNWGKVWWIDERGEVTWTASGLARKKAIEAKAAREQGHA